MPRLSATCGFDVYQCFVGTVSAKLFTDRNGSVVRELDLFRRTQLLWSAPSKGTSFSYPFNGASWYDYPQGGTVGAPATLTITGFQGGVPDLPPDAGRAVFVGEVIFLTPEGIPVVETSPVPISVTGRTGTLTFPNICAALAGFGARSRRRRAAA